MNTARARPEIREIVVAAARADTIVEVQYQRDLFDLQLRQHVVGLCQDLGPGARKFVVDELALVLAVSCGQARRLVDLSELSLAHPQLAELVVARTWSLRHHDAVLDEVAGLSAERQEQVIAATLASGARTPFQLRRAAQAALYLIDPEAAQRQAREARDNRTVGSQSGWKGDATFWAEGSKAQVAQLMAAVDTVAGRKEPGDTRTLSQRRFDALMDLVCGRVLPGQWQAVVLVKDSTIRGEDEDPAEIPGLGLITAEEARELVAQASLRRAVVDEDGRLVSVDSVVSRPDAAPAADRPAMTDAVEPVPADEDGAAVSPADLAWLAEQESHHDLQAEVEALRAPEPEADEHSQQVLRELLAYVHAHTRFPSLTAIVHDAETGLFHVDFPDDPRPPGGVSPPDLPPLPGPHGPAVITQGRHRPDMRIPHRTRPDTSQDQPPSARDLAYEDETTGHETVHSLIDWQHARQVAEAGAATPAYPPPEGGWPPEPACLPRPPDWTLEGLRRVLCRFRSRPAEPVPAASTAYPFPTRAARHIKLRDLHCTFPGCYRQAAQCDNDHVVEWPLGPTSVHNGAPECEHHHMYKHHQARSVRRLPDGGMRWSSITGYTATTPPRALIRGW